MPPRPRDRRARGGHQRLQSLENVNQRRAWERALGGQLLPMALGSDSRVKEALSLPRKAAALTGFTGDFLCRRWSFISMSLGVSNP